MHVITRSLDMLHNIYHNDLSKGPIYVPWIPLALIEWSLVFGPKSNVLSPTQINDAGFAELYNLLHDAGAGFEHKFLAPDLPFGLLKFMRCMAHQQFWFQEDYASIKRFIGRNLLLNESFETDFEALTGLKINDFYEISFVIFSFTQSEQSRKPINISLFRDFIERYNANQINFYFNLTSLNLDELQEAIRDHYRNHQTKFTAENLLAHMTPLWRFPFIKEDKNYFCIYPALVEYAIKYFLYDFLKQKGGNSFGTKFGLAVETHIKRGLDFLRTEFFDETQIQKIASAYRNKKLGQIKSVDFLIPQKSGTVLIESKAQEMPLELRTNPDQETLGRYFAPEARHLVHGIIQAFELCHFISTIQPQEFKDLNQKFYLVLVTYKDFYLGKGEDFWDEFVKDIILPYLAKKGISADLIHPENMFVISLDEYDCLISQAKNSGVQISDILDYAIAQNKEAATMRFVFRQHIHEYNKNSRFNLPYIDDGFKNLTDDIINVAKASLALRQQKA